MSPARANPKLAAYMWQCVNGVIGRDNFQKTVSTGGFIRNHQ